MVSENTRYSKYLEEEDVEVEIVEDSQLRAVDQVGDGDQVEEMDECMYSLDSERRSRG